MKCNVRRGPGRLAFSPSAYALAVLLGVISCVPGCGGSSSSDDDSAAGGQGGAAGASNQAGAGGGADTGGTGGTSTTGGSGGNAGAAGGQGGAAGMANTGGTGGSAPDAAMGGSGGSPDAGVMPDAMMNVDAGAMPDGGSMDAASNPDAAMMVDAMGCMQEGDPCKLANGDDGLCAVGGTCVACMDPDNDAECAAAYGNGYLCANGKCVIGDCHDTGDCQDGKICGITTDNTCGDCTGDGDCTAQGAYGNGYICAGTSCVMGDCHDSSECPGTVCGATTPNNCGPCTGDSQCQNDDTYGADTICFTSEGQTDTGKCVSNACTTNNSACSANAADFCCGNTCVAGNCCNDNDCLTNNDFGAGYTCKDNSCTQCDPVAAGAYVVDPMNGNDATASGSGTAGGAAATACAFRTVTRALAAIGPTPAVGTTITVLGANGMVTELYVTKVGDAEPETFPLVIPANVAIKTSGGTIRVPAPAGKVGFVLNGDGADLMGSADAPLAIDGGNDTATGGIEISNAAANSIIHHVTIKDTLGDGIRMTAGALSIGPGVEVTGSGRIDAPSSGLHASGGIVQIAVPAGMAPARFAQNSLHGIEISGTAVLNISGSPTLPPDGTGTVVSVSNTSDNLSFRQTPQAVAAPSTIDGLVAWSSTTGHGLRVAGGSRVKVRNSVILANVGNGVWVPRYANSNPGRDLSNLDLGKDGDAGANILQALPGANPNLRAGICVDLENAAGVHELAARGNVFRGIDCAGDSPGPLNRATSCVSYTDVGVEDRMGSTVTVDTADCN